MYEKERVFENMERIRRFWNRTDWKIIAKTGGSDGYRTAGKYVV